VQARLRGSGLVWMGWDGMECKEDRQVYVLYYPHDSTCCHSVDERTDRM